MYAKIAFRNVKRQIGNYLIYFITVSITVALMFAVNNLIFSEQMQTRAGSMLELRKALVLITVFISFIVAFVLGYATSFMLKLRKREFGTYLTLGMTRKNILSIFIAETLLLGLAALAAGILLGLFLYQGLMLLLIHLLEMELTIASYSLKGLLLTIGLVVAVFLLSSLTSALYLKKVSIYKLIHGDQIVTKNGKHPVLWAAFTALSLGGMIWSCIAFYNTMNDIVRGLGGSMQMIVISLSALAVSIVTFHFGLAKCAVDLLLKNKKLCSRGTNVFTFRQLSAKLQVNAMLAGALSFLIAFAIIGANCSFLQKTNAQASLDREYPFDINGRIDPENGQAVGFAEAEKVIAAYTTIQEKIPYKVYTSENGYLHSFTQFTGEGYSGLYDTFFKESDINALFALLGREPISLNGKFQIFANVPQIASCDFTDALLERNGKQYPFGGIRTDVPMIAYYYFVAVVPDEAVEGMLVASDCAAYDLPDGKYDAAGLKQALSYPYQSAREDAAYSRCDYVLREYGRMEQNSVTAIFIIGALYIAVVFVFLAMAILALKTLSGLSDDQKRYQILFRLGAGEKIQSETLFRQIFSFFLLPFVVPMLLSIPASIICMQVMKFGGFAQLKAEVLQNSMIIAGAMGLIYLLYFTATYLIAKRNVVRTNAVK